MGSSNTSGNGIFRLVTHSLSKAPAPVLLFGGVFPSVPAGACMGICPLFGGVDDPTPSLGRGSRSSRVSGNSTRADAFDASTRSKVRRIKVVRHLLCPLDKFNGGSVCFQVSWCCRTVVQESLQDTRPAISKDVLLSSKKGAPDLPWTCFVSHLLAGG